MTNRIYAVGDVHGHHDKLVEIHARIAADRQETADEVAPVIHVGDLVDRGPDSKGVVEFICNGVDRGEPWRVLLGNHDRLFRQFLGNASLRDSILRQGLNWLSDNMGGRLTLRSYGVDTAPGRPVADIQASAAARVPPRHRQLLAGMSQWYEAGDILLVHAGIRPGIPLGAQTEDDLVWIRREFHDHDGPHPWLIVHGHSVVNEVTHYGNRVNIDTGAGWGKSVSAIVIEDRKVWVLAPEGRRELRADPDA